MSTRSKCLLPKNNASHKLYYHYQPYNSNNNDLYLWLQSLTSKLHTHKNFPASARSSRTVLFGRHGQRYYCTCTYSLSHMTAIYHYLRYHYMMGENSWYTFLCETIRDLHKFHGNRFRCEFGLDLFWQLTKPCTHIIMSFSLFIFNRFVEAVPNNSFEMPSILRWCTNWWI